ncbi:MAG: hypothetical protein DRP67_01715 [Candidatus Omnitrophota bacterium]|nr:MAG: hypothetical protein DRP67_01715 [Candidatus Omnitrophota bacterium]
MEKFDTEIYSKKVLKTIRKYRLVENGDKIFIGLSGGKDSASAGYFISKYVKENNVKCDIIGFHIILGDFIPKDVEKTARKQAEIFGIPFKTIELKNLGIDMEKISKLPRPVCSSCGTIKRYLMNKIPREMGGNKLCTGHHADDFIVFFFKNILGGNISWISKFTPLLPGRNKSIARIRPLFFVGGNENKKFCDALKIPYIEENACPYISIKKRIDKRREKWYETVESISRWQPNFRYQMMNGIISLSSHLYSNLTEPKECKICGEPTDGEICAFCKILKEIK